MGNLYYQPPYQQQKGFCCSSCDPPKNPMEPVTAFDYESASMYNIDPVRKKTELIHEPTRLKGPELITAMALSPNGKTFATCSSRCRISLYDIVTGSTVEQLLLGNTHSVSILTFSPDSKLLAVAMYDSTVIVWDIAARKKIKSYKKRGDWIGSIAISPDGLLLAVALDNDVILWDIRTGDIIHTLTGHEECVKSVAFSPRQGILVSGSNDCNLRVWDIATGVVLHVFQGHEYWVTSAIFSADGKTIVSSSMDDSIKIWDLDTNALLRTFKGHGVWAASIAISPDAGILASAADDGKVRIWDINKGHQLAEFRGIEFNYGRLAFLPQELIVASATDDFRGPVMKSFIMDWGNGPDQILDDDTEYGNSVRETRLNHLTVQTGVTSNTPTKRSSPVSKMMIVSSRMDTEILPLII